MKGTKHVLILDGAMGTMLQKAGMEPGEIPGVFGMEHPAVVADIHKQYIQAGSQVIYTNTFTTNAERLAGSGHRAERVVAANVRTAVEAAAGKAKVAVCVGPAGQLVGAPGTKSFQHACGLFREVVEAGQEAGGDLVVFETFGDLQELKAAVLAAKEHTGLPVWATMSFGADGRTYMGASVAAVVEAMEELRVDAMGINCSLGPGQILPLLREMYQWTDLPLIAKPSAGLPDPDTEEYPLNAAEFAEEMKKLEGSGVGMIGGCCGTTPEYIRRLRDSI